MGKKRYYSAELKWEAVRMKEEGYLNREIMHKLGIKDRTQIQTWMRWYRTGESHRFEQPVGKQ